MRLRTPGLGLGAWQIGAAEPRVYMGMQPVAGWHGPTPTYSKIGGALAQDSAVHPEDKAQRC